MKIIKVMLTDEQLETLYPFKEELAQFEASGKPGMLIGQISENYIKVTCIDNRLGLAIQRVINPKLVGKTLSPLKEN